MLQNPELLIDKEYEDLLFSDKDCSPISRPIIYRKSRRVNNQIVRCKSCTTAYMDGILDCPYCLGTGTEWDQGLSKGWLSDNKIAYEKTITDEVPNVAGSNIYYKYVLYTPKELVLEEKDVVLVPTLDTNGKIVLPIIPIGIYSVYEKTKLSSGFRDSDYNRYKMNNTIEHSFKSIVNYYE